MAWSGSRYPAYWEFFHKINANKPQTNNIMNIDDDAITALVEQYDKEFDFAKKRRCRARSSNGSMSWPALCPPIRCPTPGKGPGAG